jgi:hypothetical protein
VAFEQLQRLQSLAARTQVLEVFVLYRNGDAPRAIALLRTHMTQAAPEPEMVEAAYVIGQETRDWPLAVQAVELQIASGPRNLDAYYFRLGQLHYEAEPHNEEKALGAFRAGLAAALPGDAARYRAAVPAALREKLS